MRNPSETLIHQPPSLLNVVLESNSMQKRRLLIQEKRPLLNIFVLLIFIDSGDIDRKILKTQLS